MVAGAGVLGVLTAYRLARAGAQVTLVDAGGLGAGTSGHSFAHVNASYAGYWDYVDLRREGVAGWRRLRDELGAAPWLHDRGFLSVLRSGERAHDLDAHLRRLGDLGYAVERVERPGDLEAALTVERVASACLYPDEGYVDLPAMLSDVAARAVALGVAVHTDDAVTGVERRSGDDPVLVGLRSGASLPADWLVSCTGRWTDELLTRAGLSTRFVADQTAAGTPVPGLLVTVTSGSGSLSRVVAVDDVNYRPAGDGRTMLWSGDLDRELAEAGGTHADPATVSRLSERLLHAAAQHVAGLENASIVSATVTQRALPVDGLPVVGVVPGVSGVYVVLAHAAATLAPALADVVTGEILHGDPDPRLARFRPRRLLPAPPGDADPAPEPPANPRRERVSCA